MFRYLTFLFTLTTLLIAPYHMRGQEAKDVSAFAYMLVLHAAKEVNDDLLSKSPPGLDLYLADNVTKKNVNDILKDYESIGFDKLPRYDELLKKVPADRLGYLQVQSIPIRLSGTSVYVQQVSAISSAAGVAVPFETQLVNATAQFIADRFKQELALTFFKSLRDSLESNQVLKRLFPNARQLLTTLLADPLLIPSMGAAWRNAFETDLRRMPYEATKWMYDDLNSVADPTLRDAVRVAYRAIDLYQRITQGQHVRNILRDYSEEVRVAKVGSGTLTQVQESVFILNYILENIEDHRGAWADRKSYLFLQDPNHLKMFTWFLNERYKKKGDTSIYTVTGLDLSNPEYQRKLQELISLVTSINSLVDELNLRDDGRDDASRKRLYYSYVQTAYRLVGVGHNLLQLMNLPPATPVPKDETFNRYIVPIGELAGQMSMHAGNGDYGAMLGDVLRLVKLIAHPDKSLKIPAPDTTNTTNGFQLLNHVRHPEMLRVASFLTDVVNAKDEKDIQNVLESVALPAGGYSIKRNSPLAISISSFVGLTGGSESSRDVVTGDFSDKPAFFFQPSALLGVDISTRATFSLCGKESKLGVSLFMGLADLGALVSYRVTQSNDSVQSTPNVGFRQIFSPTVMGTFAIGDSPFCIGFGVQLAPMLRSVTTTGATFREVDACRQFVTITCDLTLFNVFALR
ncbi:MAG: hypothetical protein FGM33_04050 [Candidatus Kapabacteria bacterium]|nr:hypothetical protein [Candidatus Kapabacteria bacterium]